MPSGRDGKYVLKADIVHANEVTVGLTALHKCLKPKDPLPHSSPLNAEMSGVDFLTWEVHTFIVCSATL